VFRSVDTDGIFHHGSGAAMGVGPEVMAVGAIGADGSAKVGGAARYIACGLGGHPVRE
jgi:hypothetical protein